MVNITQMGTKSNTEELLESIVLDYNFGLDHKQIAEKIGWKNDRVRRVIVAYETVKNRDWATAITYINSGYAFRNLEWAANRMGVELPNEVIQAQSDRTEQVTGGKAAPLENEPNQNDLIYLCKVLEALAKTNELLEQLMDVVIPKYVGDLKDNINANADILSERLKKCETNIEKITYNTRKRGT